MEVTVHRDKRIVEVWLTNQEQADTDLREKLQELYGLCRAQKYTVAQFRSGQDDLYAAVHDLLLFNRKRAAELSAQREKSLKNPILSASYSSALPIQC